MLSFYLAVIVIAAPILFIMWKRRFYQGLVLGQLVFLHTVNWYIIQAREGPFGWVAQYFNGFVELYPQYAIRWPLPTLIHFLAGITGRLDWVIWLFVTAGLWWFGSIVFSLLLMTIGFDRNWSTVGAAMPLLTLGAIQRSMFLPDCINWLVVLSLFWAIYSWRHRRQPKWLLLVPLALAVAAVVELPVAPPGGWGARVFQLPYNFGELAAAIGIWGIFILVAVIRYRHEFPQFTRMAYWFLPVYVVVFAVAVDWDRWFLLAAPVWVPMALITLQHIFTPVKQTGKNAEVNVSTSAGKGRVQRASPVKEQTPKQ